MKICDCETSPQVRSTCRTCSALAPLAAPVAAIVGLASCPEPLPALVIERLEHLPVAATQTWADLNAVTTAIEHLTVTLSDTAVQKVSQRTQRTWLAEIKQRQWQFEHWQTRLAELLPPIAALNPVLYAEELASLDLERLLAEVLDGNEMALQTALLQWSDRLSTAHADFKLRRLAIISCLVRAAEHKVRRTKLACRWFPVLGGAVTASLLQLSMDWLWTIGTTGLLVMPLIFWMTRSMRQQMQAIAQQEWQDWQLRLRAEFDHLNEQETQVRRLCDRLVNPEVAVESSAELSLRLPEPSL
jgi:hypothetical protein